MKPILFNTEMVQAILDDKKSCTRRAVKTQPDNRYKYNIGRVIESNYKTHIGKFGFYTGQGEQNVYVKPPYQKGDILYATETWKVIGTYPSEFGFDVLYKSDNLIQPCLFKDIDRYINFMKFENKNGWQSPYFMPKEAARIFLRVTDVKIEQLKDTTEEQAKKEGLESKKEFIETIIKIYPGTTLGTWVWVIEFDRISKEKAYAERN